MNILAEAKDYGMSEMAINAIMGSLLGDAALRTSGETTKAIRWNHGLCQKEYVWHKYNLLREFATQEPLDIPNPGYGDTWTVLRLRRLGLFHCLYTLLHPNGVNVKTVTPEYLDNITHPIALAWWFMDDGSRTKGSNVGHLHTNGFSEEENVMLVEWLKERWGILCRVANAVSSTSGKRSKNIYIEPLGFIRLVELIQEYVPECMRYKIELVMKPCPVCGKEFPQNGHSPCCSKACSKILRRRNKEQYAEENKEHLQEKKLEWKQAHRDEINTAAREAYANMSPEKREKLNEYKRKWRAQNPEKVRETKARYLEARRDDPVFQERKKLSDARYYQSVKADPEKHAKRLGCNRKRRTREDVRAREREYLRNRRMEKRAENPEELARYLGHKDHLEKLSNMTQEEKAAYAKERDTKARNKREAAMSPEEKAALTAKKVQQNKERLEKMRQDPVRWAKFLADEKRRREARKAKKLARQQGSSTIQ